MDGFSLPKRNGVFVENKENDTNEDCSAKGQLLFFRNCKNTKYSIKQKPTKIIIESCDNAVFRVECDILTGTLELINSSNLQVSTTTRIPTIVVEGCTNIQFHFPSGWGANKFQGSLYTSKSTGVTVDVDKHLYKIETPSAPALPTEVSTEETDASKKPNKYNKVEASSPQFISRFFDGKFGTEQVVREGVGMPTTEKEKTDAEEKEKKFNEKMDKIIDETIQMSINKKKPSKPSTTAPATSNANTLGEIRNFNKHKLKPTETVVRTEGAITTEKPGHGHSSDEDIKEYFDEPEVVKAKVKQLAQYIRDSKHLVVYTGAGISTSAKIPDYRGPQGVWTLKDKGIRPTYEITIEQALPTKAHMALVELEKKDVMKFLVSTNVDGLHRRAGNSANRMAELHGNCYKELCEQCRKEYLRTFDVAVGRRDHKTGRKCSECGGHLIDSIINFGENLPESEVKSTELHSKQSDLALVMGTSMKVSPACNYPIRAVKNQGKMVICNLQVTPYDKYATLLIRARTDQIMELLMQELGLTIPEYKLENDAIKSI